MSIMSTSVVHRRGNVASESSRNSKGNKKSNDNGYDYDDKQAKPLKVRPIFGGLVMALLFVLGITLLLRKDSSKTKTMRSPSIPTATTQHIRHDEREARAVVETSEVHQMIFSTGCTPNQHWQSYVFFYHAFKAGQPGHVTRIASGCSPTEAEELKKLHKERIEIMSDRFHLHLTPDFSKSMKPGINYKFANKPNGVRHWMEHALGYPKSTEHDDDIIMLLDPDQMLLRPLINDFENTVVDWKPTKDDMKSIARVEHGSPAGQLYGFGGQWRTKVNVTHVAGPDSPIQEVTTQQARDHYPLGPPYIATARDMYKIVERWCDFLPRVHDDYPHLLAEMFAYCLAAAHWRLPHQVAKSFMVSDAYSGAEGWSLADKIPTENTCYGAPPDKLPHVLHYCQRYLLGKFLISKYRLPKNFISCESPLLMEPPADIAQRYNYSIAPFETERHYYSRKEVINRHAFMLCTMIKGLNEASEYFKKHNCPAESGNFEKSLIFHDTIED